MLEMERHPHEKHSLIEKKRKRSNEDRILTFKLQVHSIHYTVELKKITAGRPMTKDTSWTFQVAKKFKFWMPSWGEILTLHTFIEAEGRMWLEPGRSLP